MVLKFQIGLSQVRSFVVTSTAVSYKLGSDKLEWSYKCHFVVSGTVCHDYTVSFCGQCYCEPGCKYMIAIYHLHAH